MNNQEPIQPTEKQGVSRRLFVGAGAAAALGTVFWLNNTSKIVRASDTPARNVVIVAFSPSGHRGDTLTVKTIVKTDAEWRAQLSPQAYHVTREAGTERPYSGPYGELHEQGVFTCVCCDTALFNADTKFDSGTGWPSFWQPIARENVSETRDSTLGIERTAVSCRRCDAHLGHVFDDGPRPTGLRYCMNAAAMKFEKAV